MSITVKQLKKELAKIEDDGQVFIETDKTLWIVKTIRIDEMLSGTEKVKGFVISCH